MQLTRSLALRYAAQGIGVNAIAPGWIETWSTRAVRDDAARCGAIRARTPKGALGPAGGHRRRGGLPMLAGPAAFVTGATLPVDGGHRAA